MSLSVSTSNQPAPFSPPPVHRWVWPIAAMTFVLGMFIALAVKSEKLYLERESPSTNLNGIVKAYHSLDQTVHGQQARILELQNELTKATNDSGSGGQVARQLSEARFLAGLTKVKGPGILVTLNDSQKRPPPNLPNSMSTDLTKLYIIHDDDIERLLNELRAGGAEAMAINDQRVVATTPVRCVGPAIQVNGVPLTPPFRIAVIGDPQSLDSTLKLPGGIAEILKSTDPAMMSGALKQSLVLPAYAGVETRYAKPL